jgi:hypothetical protein
LSRAPWRNQRAAEAAKVTPRFRSAAACRVDALSIKQRVRSWVRQLQFARF